MPRPARQKLSFAELLVELANAHEKELNDLSDKLGFAGREGYVYRGMSKSHHTHQAGGNEKEKGGNEKRGHGKLDSRTSKDPPRSRHPVGNNKTLFDTMASDEGDTEIVQASKLPGAPDLQPSVSSSDEAPAITREPPNLQLHPPLPSKEPPTINKASSYEPPSSAPAWEQTPNSIEQHAAQQHPHAVPHDNLDSTLRGLHPVKEKNVDEDEEERLRAKVIKWLSDRKGRGGMLQTLQEKWVSMTERCQEPERDCLVARVVTSTYFQIASTVVIVLNAFTTMLQADIDMRSLGKEKSSVLEVLELVFLGWYTLELGLKLYVHRLYFFWNEDTAWGVFDLCLVVQGLVEVIMARVFDNAGANLAFARMIRLLKLSKIFRIFRMVKFLKDLRTMLMSVVSSFIAMLWAFLLLIIVVFMAALVFVQLQSGFLIAADADGILDQIPVEAIRKEYGSVTTAMLSLFMATTGGNDWITYYEPLEAEEGGVSRFLFVGFIFFWQFSMVNVVTGIVMEKAVRNAQPDRDELMAEQRRDQERSVRELQLLFKEMDTDNSDEITMIEFVECLKDTAIQDYFATIGLSFQDARYFFQVLADTVGSDSVPMEDFILHCSHMKGTAMAVDLIELAWEVKSIKSMLCTLTGTTQVRRSRLSRF
eukprot:TRINITY_DN5433_c0_g1_i2.p1 TRINITY_DN5433_c0_g1~~TRINITY_DN5433_c0_g1_i2.p1  ORF type:complete len:668 (+),score=120.02 TRINITY_DN5433_c0_g1_i2:58-2004(+)